MYLYTKVLLPHSYMPKSYRALVWWDLCARETESQCPGITHVYVVYKVSVGGERWSYCTLLRLSGVAPIFPPIVSIQWAVWPLFALS